MKDLIIFNIYIQTFNIFIKLSKKIDIQTQKFVRGLFVKIIIKN